MERFLLEPLRRLTLKKVCNLLDFVGMAPNHEMNVLRQNGTGPNRVAAFAQSVGKALSDNSSLVAGKDHRRVPEGLYSLCAPAGPLADVHCRTLQGFCRLAEPC